MVSGFSSTTSRNGESMASGPVNGCPIVDVKVRLVDGSYHEVDSSEISFKVAGSMAFTDAAKKAEPVLLEPIMEVEAVTPEGEEVIRRGRAILAEVAAINILMTFHLTVLLPAFGVALAATTLVGNALGRQDADDAARWGWNCAALTFVYGITVGLLLIPLAEPVLALFLTNPETRELAWLPMILWASVIGFDTAAAGDLDQRRALHQLLRRFRRNGGLRDRQPVPRR